MLLDTHRQACCAQYAIVQQQCCNIMVDLRWSPCRYSTRQCAEGAAYALPRRQRQQPCTVLTSSAHEPAAVTGRTCAVTAPCSQIPRLVLPMSTFALQCGGCCWLQSSTRVNPHGSAGRTVVKRREGKLLVLPNIPWAGGLERTDTTPRVLPPSYVQKCNTSLQSWCSSRRDAGQQPCSYAFN